MSYRSTAPTLIPPRHCCSASEALAWLQLVAGLGLAGDEYAARMVPVAAEHWLRSLRVEVVG
jgi:hypothetical protein